MFNISILSFYSSSLFLTSSPIFTDNHFSIINSNFHKYSTTLFYNQKFLEVEKTKFDRCFGGIIINEEETYIHQTIQNEQFTTTLPIDLSQKRSISIINCQFSNIKEKDVINIGNDKISLYITSTTFISCTASDCVILLKNTRCFTMTHVCTYQSGSKNQAGILNYNIHGNDFLLCLYNSFVNSLVGSTGGRCIIYATNGNQYYRCNNLTGSEHRGYHISSPKCFSFGLSTTMKCKDECFRFFEYDINLYTPDKKVEMSNFFNNAEYLFDFYGTNSITFTFIKCVLLNENQNVPLFLLNLLVEVYIKVQNCIILDGYRNSDNIEYIECTVVNSYDEKYVTLHAHYTHGEECLGKAEIDKNEHGCESGECIDESCDQKIEFPGDVVPFTTFCHECTPIFSETSLFSESSKFSPLFSESTINSISFSFLLPTTKYIYETSPLNNNQNTFSLTLIETFTNIRTVMFSYSYTISISAFSCTNDENICETIIYIERHLPYIIYSISASFIEIYISHNILVKKLKINNEQMIGIVCGTVAAFFTILAIIIFIIQRKNKIKHYLDSTEDDTQSDASTNEKQISFSIPNNNTQIDDWI